MRRKKSLFKRLLVGLAALFLIGSAYTWYKEGQFYDYLETLNTRYAYRKRLGDVSVYLRKRYDQDFTARISIDASAINSKKPTHALVELAHLIRALVKVPTNQGLFLMFDSNPDSSEWLEGFNTCEMLLKAITYYKKETTRPVFAFSREFNIKSYFIASAADEIITTPQSRLYTTRDMQSFFEEQVGGESTPLEENFEEDRKIVINKPSWDSAKLSGTISVGKYKRIMPHKDWFANSCTRLDFFEKKVQENRKKQFGGRSYQRQVRNVPNKAKEDSIPTSIMLRASEAQELGFVDKIVAYKGLNAHIQERCGGAVIENLTWDNASDIPSFVPLSRKTYIHGYLPIVKQETIDIIYIQGKIGDKEAEILTPLLKMAAIHPYVKGVILVINTPGGSVKACDKICGYVNEIAQHKPIIAYVQNQCCSGGYQIASQTNRIIAHKTASIGSIGCTITLNSFSEEEETKRTAKKCYIEFIQYVARKRHKICNMTRARYEQELIATQARTFFAAKAKKKKLIDDIGDLQDALAMMKDRVDENCEVFYHAPLPKAPTNKKKAWAHYNKETFKNLLAWYMKVQSYSKRFLG